MGTRKPSVFVREATGLVKNVSLLDAVAINVSDMSAGAALAVVGFTTILLPTMAGVNLVYGSLIATASSNETFLTRPVASLTKTDGLRVPIEGTRRGR